MMQGSHSAWDWKVISGPPSPERGLLGWGAVKPSPVAGYRSTDNDAPAAAGYGRPRRESEAFACHFVSEGSARGSETDKAIPARRN
jgi:hypothetical protein